MSTYDQTKEMAGKKAEETKAFGEDKAEQAHGATKVHTQDTDWGSLSFVTLNSNRFY